MAWQTNNNKDSVICSTASPSKTREDWKWGTKKDIEDLFKESTDYVTIAENNLIYRYPPDTNNKNKYNFGRLTTSKIRNILSIVNGIYNKLVLNTSSDELDPDITNEIRYMKVRFIYEAGRESDVETFCSNTKIIDAIDLINTKNDFIRYSRYLEALVAYHRFYGGKD